MWYFENMDNPIVNQPIPKKKISKNNSSINNKPQINEELVETIISIINCSRDQAVGALTKCDNDIERSIDYIYSHPDESFSNDSSVQEQKISNQVDSIEFNKNNSPIYNMYGFITHLGKNTSFGHYVCHIKKENNWIYYNDSRVSISNDPPFSKGFIFVFKNKN
jgi:ubiquitin carboxyl-terminal hydrolase 5/13